MVAALVFNALLGGATVLLAHRTAAELAGPRAAWWAGLLCAVEPGQILMSGFVLAEAHLASLVTALAAAGLRYLRTPGPHGALSLGLLAGRARGASTGATASTGLVLTLTDPGGNLLLNLFHPSPPRHPMLVKQLLTRGWRRAAVLARRAAVPLLAAEGVLFALLLPYLILAARGAVLAPQRRARLWLLSLAAYFLILSSGPFSQMRFRAPVMPVLSVLAGSAIAARRAATLRPRALRP